MRTGMTVAVGIERFSFMLPDARYGPSRDASPSLSLEREEARPGPQLAHENSRRRMTRKPPVAPYPPDLDEEVEGPAELGDVVDVLVDNRDWANSRTRA